MNRRELIFVLIALASAGAYLLFSYLRGGIGFPLDDAWIHQVYARNLGTRGEFAFFPGQPSAGSTSPLWAILLSLGYFLRIDFHFWTYLLGAGLVGLCSIFLARLAQKISPTSLLLALSFSLFALLEWHLAWSAVSGMEIPLFVFLSLFLVERFYAHERTWVLGLIAGLLALTRPEGAALAVLVGAGISLPLMRAGQGRGLASFNIVRAFLVQTLLYTLGFTVLIAPYVAFNLVTSGTIFPNTFYAKNAEYTELIRSTPFIARWIQLLAVPWVGAQVLLLPGFVFIIARLVHQSDYRALLPFAWILLLPALYALRLPEAYQHGRYEMPIVPFIVLYGIWGMSHLFVRIKYFVVRATWAISTAVALVVFWVMGANAYSADVAFIDCEMVQTARWVAAYAAPDTLVAAHDIGALGYYYDRPFIDLAGLVSPEVIPFITNEIRLRDYLLARNTTLAIFFPDFSPWYAALASDPRFIPVHQSNCRATQEQGAKNMVVYQIR